MEKPRRTSPDHHSPQTTHRTGGIAIAGCLLVTAVAAGGVWWYESSRHDSQQHTQVEGDLLDGQWDYLAGAERQKDGLQIAHTGLAIVEQDGSGGQPNPPVNEYGTRLEVAGGFVVEATVQDMQGPADIQLYGEVPVIQDEFRVEPPSVRMEVTDSALQVSVWDGQATQDLTNQRPVEHQSFPINAGSSADIRMVRADGKLDFSVDGKAVGSVGEHDIFHTGRLWFGMDAPTAGGHWLLSGLEATAVDGGTVTAVDTSRTQDITQDENGLQRLADKKRPGFLMGSAMALGPAVSDGKYATIAFGGNFGQMTVENAMKFQFVHPQPDQYTFQEADALVDMAHERGLKVHGHALVFGEALPRWVQDMPTGTQEQKDKVRDVMVAHIKAMVTHFKGKVASWDVVNEPLADYDDTEDGEGAALRQNKWFQAMGADYIAIAVRAAREADPDVDLYINEYGLESDGDRWDAFVTLLQQAGQHVGVGFQSHVYEADDQIDTATLRDHIRQLAALGRKARISEMDVYNDDGTAVQAQQYADVLATCLGEPTCVSFTTWGFDDDYDMWQEDDHSLQHGQDLLWQRGARASPAVGRLQEVLQK